MKVDVFNMKGDKVETVELPAEIFETPVNVDLMHQAYIQQMANARLGTHKTKTRSEVSGGGKKPWKQKGTGRARAGSVRSPLWAGGGVVFGPKPRDFSKTISKKTRQLALRKALSERLKLGDVVIVDDLKLASPKTKEFVGVISALELKGTTLVISSGIDKNLTLASRNLEKVALTTSDSLNTYDVLRPDKLLFTRSAFEKVEARLSQE